MKRAIRVEIDDNEHTDPLAYVYYSDQPRRDPISSRSLDGKMIVHTDAATGELVGIELLNLQLHTLHDARETAASHGAEFPSYLAARM